MYVTYIERKLIDIKIYRIVRLIWIALITQEIKNGTVKVTR